jgi:hypothetical protein
MGNKIRKEQLGKLQEIMRSKPNLVSLCGIADDATEADLSDIGMDAHDVVILASELPNKRALTRLDVSSNNLVGEKGTGRYVTTDPQYSGDEGEEEEIMEPDFSGIFALANAIPNMRALTTLDISSNGLGVPDQLPDGWIYRPHFTKSAIYQHTDERMPLHERMQGHPPTGSKFRGLDALANAIRDMRALSVVNIMGNLIGKDMLSKLQEIMRSKPNLISLCGIADDATEADLSGLGVDADDAITLALELPDKRVMTSLNLANNNLGGWNGEFGSKCQYDTSGIEFLALAWLIMTSASLLPQVLSLLPTPSPTWGR